MSEETRTAVEDAIRAHMADQNDGALLTSWIVVSAGISANESNMTHYMYMNHDGSPHEWIGLLGMASRRATAILHSHDNDDDD